MSKQTGATTLPLAQPAGSGAKGQLPTDTYVMRLMHMALRSARPHVVSQSLSKNNPLAPRARMAMAQLDHALAFCDEVLTASGRCELKDLYPAS